MKFVYFREASDKELEKDLPTLKDNDFVKQQTKVYIGEDAKTKLLETLSADVGFLTRLHLMDYSLLLGIHECERGESESKQRQSGNPPESESENTGLESDESEETATAQGWSGWNTPPDSPLVKERSLGREYDFAVGDIIPELDIYAIPSCETAPIKEIYFVAIIDVLTHYGVKKQAAKAAKTVKYGGNVDGISTCDPEQYARRFIEFMTKAIE